MRRRPGRGVRTATATAGPAFTLVELLIVLVIIGIILAFILSAAMDGIRRSEERATQALIAKLEAGLIDRVDAVLSARADKNSAHDYLSYINLATLSTARAQLIARAEQVAFELPDVFVVQSNTSYPINFGGMPFPAGAGTPVAGYTSPYAYYMLPFGVAIYDDPTGATVGSNSFGGTKPSVPQKAPDTVGIFGASYSAAAGIYKNLVAAAIANGATPPTPIDRGYNGVDDDGNGLVDDLGENGATVQTAVVALLANHTHKTARSEMLYALLVEGQGPLGSTFSADDFSDSEVKDTDGDGLPEFVDAWGEPLQFYRWPVGYADDTQKGLGTYSGVFESRQQNPLDPNQTFLDPAWWSTFNSATPPYLSSTTPSPLSAPAYVVHSMFLPLVDPNAHSGLGLVGTGKLWDRGPTYPARRAFYSRYLVLSGGPDRTPGVPVFDPDWYQRLADYTGASVTGPVIAGKSPVAVSTSLDSHPLLPLRIEGSATQANFNRTDTVYRTLAGPAQFPGGDAISAAIQEAGNDDITNHNLQGPGGATQ